ncbi:hypothetical protein GZ77_03855 [Endozoicomonas montiporae]|uniref:Head protein n=2 Tax=Endozoicomonas montiporae TaxID=1027273 RepID=A0A081NB88_9GAMM|nr:head completion/stabilization protein [Endozoicomonas montiporae]AMO56563.1 head completion protein [Endozoicomonas montiporae CL-33]KEQ15711.1 hypothetical protein GZ77_03855 [Endozoicomonas montiporae]
MSFSGLPDQAVDSTVSNDGFWPDLDTGEFQKNYRLPAEYELGMVEDNLQLGMASVNHTLRKWKAEQQEAGHDSMDSVPSDQIGGDKLTLIYYRRAVFCHAKALLLQQFATTDRREAANNEAKESEETEDKFLEFSRHAITDFLGLCRIGVYDL